MRTACTNTKRELSPERVADSVGGSTYLHLSGVFPHLSSEVAVAFSEVLTSQGMIHPPTWWALRSDISCIFHGKKSSLEFAEPTDQMQNLDGLVHRCSTSYNESAPQGSGDVATC